MALACLLTGDSLSLILTPLAQSAGSSVAGPKWISMPSWIYRFPSCSFSCFFAALHVVFAATCTLCSPRRRHGSALRRGVRDGVATVRETSRRSRRGVGGNGGGRSRRFSGGPALSAGPTTHDLGSYRTAVPAAASQDQKKRPQQGT